MDLETKQRIDTLTLQTADLTVELDNMKEKMSSPPIPLQYESLTPPSDIMKSITTIIDSKFHTLPNIIKHEIDQSPTFKHLQNTSTVNLHTTLIDIQKRHKTSTRTQGFQQHELWIFMLANY